MASFANPSSTTSSLQESLARRDLVLVNIAAPDVPVTDYKVALPNDFCAFGSFVQPKVSERQEQCRLVIIARVALFCSFLVVLF